MNPPVFAHGHLRLYLLSLLDERPRHGYELIQALSDRFDGQYAPSAGTIYPRLAKLEEEGLVTKESEGRKSIYRITEAGRQELADRADELAAIERDVDSSVERLARQVREGLASARAKLREEFSAAAAAAAASSRMTGGDDPAGAGDDGRATAEGEHGQRPHGEHSWNTEDFQRRSAEWGRRAGEAAQEGATWFAAAATEFGERLPESAERWASKAEEFFGRGTEPPSGPGHAWAPGSGPKEGPREWTPGDDATADGSTAPGTTDADAGAAARAEAPADARPGARPAEPAAETPGREGEPAGSANESGAAHATPRPSAGPAPTPTGDEPGGRAGERGSGDGDGMPTGGPSHSSTPLTGLASADAVLDRFRQDLRHDLRDADRSRPLAPEIAALLDHELGRVRDLVRSVLRVK